MVEPSINTAEDIRIFDRRAVKDRRLRAVQNFNNYGFLFDWVREQICDRLNDIKRDFPSSVQLGTRGGRIRADTLMLDLDSGLSPDCVADDEFLPLKENSLDLIMSNLNLHSVNDLPGALLQIRRALKPDGMFIAAIFGGESLHELRDSLTQSEMRNKDGISPRVFPFADKQQMGALLQRAGFALPVVDSDTLSVTYDNMFKLMADLRGMGESNVIEARDKRKPSKKIISKLATIRPSSSA